MSNFLLAGFWAVGAIFALCVLYVGMRILFWLLLATLALGGLYIGLRILTSEPTDAL